MSRVYVALETSLGRKVVIKVLPPDLAAVLSGDRFHREIQLAASLQHPHIVPLFSAGEAGDLVYYTMPLVEGESVRARLNRQGELPVAEASRVLRDVADALSYAHRRGVVHRDIKPDNVLLSGPHALVTDFGVAKALEVAGEHSTLTATGMALGTPAYMAPEQAAADPHTDHRADIYALGVLGYEMLAGRPPFTGPTPQAIIAAQLTQPVAPIAESRPGIPPALAAIVMRCLEKRPADRWQSAAEVLASIESLGAPALAKAAATPWWRHRRAVVAAGIGALIVAATVWLVRRPAESSPLDPNLVAVAPFDVPDPKLSLWREGLVDLLSRNLDGAGPLRSVPPTTVIRRWRGRSDRLSAAELGRRTNARLIVFGNLLGTGPDSVRLTVTALDALSERPLAELELKDVADRMDRLADSLTVRLLRELGRSRGIEVLRAGSLGSTSLPAVKAFLEGEQWFRRAAWDSALASYQRALALDSTFPLALRRASHVLGWRRTAFDSVAEALALQAGALNHGLAPRDSLLVAADSLSAALYATIPLAEGSVVRRAHDVARELTRRYPDDFESWYTLGEVRYHFGSLVGSSHRQALESFERAIAMDSSFAPAYIHPVQLALRLEGPEAAGRFAEGYLRLGPTDVSASGMGLALRIIRAWRTEPSEIGRLVRNASAQALIDAWGALSLAVDSAESAIAVARALVDAPQGDAPWSSPDDRKRRLGVTLLYRGHVTEAARLLTETPTTIPPHLVEATLLGAAPPESTGIVFRRWHEEGSIRDVAALPWWLARRDSVVLGEIQRRGDSAARAASPGAVRNRAAYASEAARAFLALLRGDSAAALRGLDALPDSLCPVCHFHRLTLAQLLSAAGENEKAARLLERSQSDLTLPSDVLWALERARVAERVGDVTTAARDYQYVVDVWRRADPHLQPYVAEAREGLLRVSGEPGS